MLQPNDSRIDSGVPTSIPDVAGLSLREAALAYAEAGWFVFPLIPGAKGQPVVKFSTESTRDPAQIARWWDEDPDRGIGGHVGRSGAVAFDLDNARLDELPAAIAQGLRSGRVQLSRRDNPDRGHYVFAAEPGAFGNGAGAFRPFGEVRGKNGFIVLAPTPHVKDDGEYRWVQPGPLPPLPEALRACLSTVTAEEVEPLTNEQFDAFVANPDHQRSERTGALDGILAKFEKDVRSGVSSHEALIDALPWAFREVRVGLYPAEEAVRRIQSAFLDSFTWEGRNPDGRTRPTGDEFYRAATWAAARAMQADPAEILERVNRNGAAAVAVDEEAFWTARPELEQLRVFARSRRVGPWAMFGVVLARALATVPPSVVLPPLRGGHGSLNFFAAIVAPSGKGKGTAEAAAEEALITTLRCTRPPWVAVRAYRRSSPTRSAPSKSTCAIRCCTPRPRSTR
ncbi:bifunctional DNA primase/polymerase [Williamsia deligens]|uniref:Bifunctional DNA primase/polymerase n=1 Tax=Williamsia deligens TaxID=321325 RepID=A0ABW3G8Z0_9NOCA|nr:bifunctional DNA primase/polymerase [Williamsia deligens]